jgi:hypothetical protein
MIELTTLLFMCVLAILVMEGVEMLEEKRRDNENI